MNFNTSHLTASKPAGWQHRDSISFVLKRQSTEVRLGQTNQLVMAHACRGNTSDVLSSLSRTSGTPQS